MTAKEVLLLLVCVCGPATPFSGSCSDGVPPPVFPNEISPAPTLKRHPTRSMTMGPLTIRFEKTTLEEVRKAIGIGKIHEKGDAGEHFSWLCYTSPQRGDSWRVWLLSHGEMDPEGQIYGIAATSMTTGSSGPSCPKLPAKFRPVALDNRLWLNATESNVRRHLGNPSLRSGSWAHYGSKKVLKNDPRGKAWGGGDWIESGGLSVRLVSERVVELWAMYSESGE